MHLHCTKGSLWIHGLDNTPFVSNSVGPRIYTHLSHGVSSFPQNVEHSFVTLLRQCARKKDLHWGTCIHEDLLRQGLLEQCSNALIAMYAQCGALTKSKDLLGHVRCKDVFAWTALIDGCAQHGLDQDAFHYFTQMKHAGIFPDAVTFACVLRACGNTQDLKRGEQIHDDITKQGLLDTSTELGNSLVTMYAKCGALVKARQVLEELPSRDVVSWSALIAGYVQHGKGDEALLCFDQMQCEGLHGNAVTLICVLKACGIIGSAEQGERIHHYVLKTGLLKDDIMLATALVDMYTKCGTLAKARQVLDEFPSRDVIIWNTLIAGLIDHGEVEQALKLFRQMQVEGFRPTSVSFIWILKACGAAGAIEEGEKVHEEIEKQGLLKNDLILSNAVLDMYVKCGALMKAWKVLDELKVKDVISWNSVIAGCVHNGDGDQVWSLLEKMKNDGFSPDTATFSSVLSACCHTGWVKHGQLFFLQMVGILGIKPDLQHVTCVIDLLGRVGHLDMAAELVKKIRLTDNGVWSALLSACQRLGNRSVARWVFEHALQVE